MQKRAIYFFLLITAALTPLFGDVAFPGEMKKNNEDGSGRRYEGFFSLPHDPEEFKFEFLSASILTDLRPPRNLERYTLVFFLQEPLEGLQIIIRNRKRNYVMSPLQTKWQKNNNTFSWEAKLAAENSLTPAGLECLIKLPRQNIWEDFTLVPVLITYNRQVPERIGGYAFSFQSNFITTTSLTIYDEKETLAAKFPPQTVREKRSVIFKWNPKNHEKGIYFLVINTVLQMENKKEEMIFSYRFYHPGELR